MITVRKLGVVTQKKERFFVIDAASNAVVLNLESEALFSGEALARIVGFCLVSKIDISSLVFARTLDTDTTADAKTQISALLDQLRAMEKPEVRLTYRERDVLKELFEHKQNKEIACNLHVSERTVKFFVSSLLMKFKAHSRHELLDLASRYRT